MMEEEIGRYIEIARLVSKFMTGRLDAVEEGKLKAWLDEDPLNRERCRAYIEEAIEKQAEQPYVGDEEWKSFAGRYRLESSKVYPRRWMKYAAVLLVVLGSFIFFIHEYRESAQSGPLQRVAAVGVDMPSLTLADGNVIALEETGSRLLIVDSCHTIRYQQGKTISGGNGTIPGRQIEYNTISVPACCEYSIRLDDGTSIQLNAGTSLKFPTCFPAAAREVWLSGEAYFQVTGQNGKPFVVHLANGDVKVLGTAFNVSAYGGEECRTTLVKGSIKYVSGNDSIVLLPGTQVFARKGSGAFEVREVDVNTAIAWTEGRFYFKEETLDRILKSLGRWYGLGISYRDISCGSLRFTVETDRYDKIDDILEMISDTDKVKLERRGNIIIVK